MAHPYHQHREHQVAHRRVDPLLREEPAGAKRHNHSAAFSKVTSKTAAEQHDSSAGHKAPKRFARGGGVKKADGGTANQVTRSAKGDSVGKKDPSRYGDANDDVTSNEVGYLLKRSDWKAPGRIYGDDSTANKGQQFARGGKVRKAEGGGLDSGISDFMSKSITDPPGAKISGKVRNPFSYGRIKDRPPIRISGPTPAPINEYARGGKVKSGHQTNIAIVIPHRGQQQPMAGAPPAMAGAPPPAAPPMPGPGGPPPPGMPPGVPMRKSGGRVRKADGGTAAALPPSPFTDKPVPSQGNFADIIKSNPKLLRILQKYAGNASGGRIAKAGGGATSPPKPPLKPAAPATKEPVGGWPTQAERDWQAMKDRNWARGGSIAGEPTKGDIRAWSKRAKSNSYARGGAGSGVGRLEKAEHQKSK